MFEVSKHVMVLELDLDVLQELVTFLIAYLELHVYQVIVLVKYFVCTNLHAEFTSFKILFNLHTVVFWPSQKSFYLVLV